MVRIVVQRGHMILMLGDPRCFGRFGFVAAIPMAIHPYPDLFAELLRLDCGVARRKR